MLAVKTLIDKYTQTNQKLYTCFIDFSKAFDTVWRDALFYKLLKMGIGGPFAKLLKNMYDKFSIQIALQNGLSDPFHDSIGVKQGCVLSPTLFKIFIADMGDIFNSACQPAQLFEEKISCLMFADDAVLISESAEGLQHALDKIKEFSDKWLLNINTEKTKVMIFNKSGKLLKDKFTLGNVHLQNVNSYTYLGLMFVPNGSFNQAIETLCRKASTAMFKLRRSLSKLNIIRAKHQVFNVRIDNYELFDKHCFEKLELKFCKAILGVHKKASNVAVRGELGRYPTLICILKQVLNNWFRITSYHHKQSILYNTYMCNLEIHFAKKCCWWSNVRNFFKETLGLPFLTENHGTKGNPKAKIDTAVKNMKSIFEFQWRNELSRTSSRNKTGEINKNLLHF